MRTETRDDLGSAVFTWSELETVWADVRMSHGSERFVSGADQELAQATHRIRIRFRDDVSALNRVVHDEKIMDVESVGDPDGRGRELVMLCREPVVA